MVSIVIPCYNEEKIIINQLRSLESLEGDFEVLVVVGKNSSDATWGLVKAYRAGYALRLISSEIGTRSDNMNTGAREARGDYLLFLHGDIRLPKDAVLQIRNFFLLSNNVAGAFKLKFNTKKVIFKYLALFSNTRARFFKMYHGDQTIFVRRDIFEKMRGYRNIPLMEDVAFSLDIKKQGKTKQLSSCILASPRRIEANGVAKMAFIYIYLRILFYSGFDIEYIARVYRGLRRG